MLVVESTRRDVYFNLALEEYLLDHRAEFDRALLLYVNDAALVIGKNQNPWRECNVGLARREGVPLARRISGGGAVYHDPGNLNYSFILPRAGYQQADVFARVINALQRVGVSAARQGKSNLVAGGRKISGNAFCYRKEAVIHHGTLLVTSDLAKLHRLLRPSLPAIQTRAIASIPASVVNLAELKPGLTVKRVADALVGEMPPDARRASGQDFDASVLEPLIQKYRSWEAVFGATPPFEITLSAGSARLDLKVARGCVERATLDAGDGLDALEGCQFGSHDLDVRLRELGRKHGVFVQFAVAMAAGGP